MLIEDLQNTIDLWIKELERYELVQIYARPNPKSWSLGQIVVHLIDDTNFYLEQAKMCLSTNEHTMEEASPAAKKMFSNNDFPDELIEGAPANAYVRQPDNKEQLMTSLMDLKHELGNIHLLMSTSLCKGKTGHPGLGYFNADAWIQFAEMHFRHHLRQKKRIDDYLKLIKI